MSTLSAVAALALGASQVVAQPISPLSTRVDSLMRVEMARRLIPGAAVAIVRDGKVVHTAAYGLASLELDVPATTRTLFQIASATKNVTGVAVLQLVEAGTFTLDDRVTTLLDGLPQAWGAVTVRQLLSHTSGLPDVIIDPEKGTWLQGSRDSVLAQLSRMPLAPAGRAWAYNQTNYLLLAMLIERYGAMPYRDYMQQKVLVPFGLRDVVFGDSRTIARGRTTEYTRLGVRSDARSLTDLKALSYEYPDDLYTAAGIFMHAEDLARWLLAVSQGAGLSRKSFDAMTTTVRLLDGTPFHFTDSTTGYGLGWIAIDAPPRRAFGGSGGGRAALFVYPDERLAVAVITNLQGAAPESLVEAVAGVYRAGR